MYALMRGPPVTSKGNPMSKKNFEALASMVYHMRDALLPSGQRLSEEARREFALSLARELWNTNARFDKARFLQACGI